MKPRRWTLALAACLGLALAAPTTNAAPTAEAARLMKKRDSERYEVRTSVSSTKAGAARVHVAAPSSVVRKVVKDFRHYEDFIKKFKKSKVVGRDGKKTLVYMKTPILKGAANIWAVVAFDPIKKVGREWVLEGKMVKGNVKHFNAKWRIQEIDKDDTQVNLELLIVPKLPVPGSVITGEVAYAADVAVMGTRDRAESRHKNKKR